MLDPLTVAVAIEMSIQNLILIVFTPIIISIMNLTLSSLLLLVLLREQARHSCLLSYKPLSYLQLARAAPEMIIPLLVSTQNMMQLIKTRIWFIKPPCMWIKTNGRLIGSKLTYYQKNRFYFLGSYGGIQGARGLFCNLGLNSTLLALRINFGRNATHCNRKRLQIHAWLILSVYHCWLLHRWINVDNDLIIHKHMINHRYLSYSA